MLSIKQRQSYLKDLGFYSGEVDGIAGAKTQAAYKALQSKYFVRKSDIDGVYGKNTDILLVNAYNVKKYTKNFKLEEFSCNCGGAHCTGYPVYLDINLLKNVQKVRDRFGSVIVTSGMRCTKHNKAVGGVSGSRHKSGKALDIRVAKHTTEAGRKKVMSYWRTLPQNRYTYCNIGGNYPNMGTSVHIDVS